MYQPYIRQKIFEARARELERIAADDRVAQAVEEAPPPRGRSIFRLVTRRVAHR